MLASVLIIAFSFVLFVYWFRYSCILLIRNRAEQPSLARDFNYLTVRRDLQAGAELDPLHRSLERDYRVLTYLLEHASSFALEGGEYLLLGLDYNLIQGC